MKESSHDSIRRKNWRCLVVEDNYYAADVMSIYLQRIGIECVIAENGEIGLELYLGNPCHYHLIFCDLQMPVMDGYEMMNKIRGSGLSTALTIPIVAMSGTISGDSVGQSRFSYFLKKPFELKSLPGIIDEVMSDQTIFESDKP